MSAMEEIKVMVGRIETKVDRIEGDIEKIVTKVEKDSDRISSLESVKAWVKGAFAAVGALFGFLAQDILGKK